MDFEIIKELGVLSESSKGWQKILAVVRWGDGKPKLDIRSWSPDREKCSKGVTITFGEAECLRDLLGDKLYEVESQIV